MKNSFNNSLLKICTCLALGLLFSAPLGLASSTLDQRYSLEVVGGLRSWDNVDGLFGDAVLKRYEAFFSKQSRFQFRSAKAVDDLLLKSKLPYYKVVDDADILKKVAESLKVDSLIKTKIYKEGARYRFIQEWVHGGTLEVLATHTFYFDEPDASKASGDGFIGGSALADALDESLRQLISKIPFRGHVTGRDQTWTTVNIGHDAEVKPGYTYVLGTVSDVQVHPLLKTIVGWSFEETGRCVVEQVDDSISFCRVIEEKPGRKVSRFQKVQKILETAPTPAPTYSTENGILNPVNEPIPEQKAQIGYVVGGLWAGYFSRQYTVPRGTRGGEGWIRGIEGAGQLWLSQDFFVDLSGGFGNFDYSQTDLITAEPSALQNATGSLTRFRISGSYNYHIGPVMKGARIFGKLGYQNTRFKLPVSELDLVGPERMSTLFLGMGTDFPVRDPVRMGLSLDYGLIKAAVDETPSNDPPSLETVNDVTLDVFVQYQYSSRLYFKLGFDAIFHSYDFSSGGSLLHRAILVSPSVIYTF